VARRSEGLGCIEKRLLNQLHWVGGHKRDVGIWDWAGRYILELLANKRLTVEHNLDDGSALLLSEFDRGAQSAGKRFIDDLDRFHIKQDIHRQDSGRCAFQAAGSSSNCRSPRRFCL